METENLRKIFADKQIVESYFEKPLSIREIERRCVLVSFKHLFDNPTLLLFDYSYAYNDESFIRQIK